MDFLLKDEKILEQGFFSSSLPITLRVEDVLKY